MLFADLGPQRSGHSADHAVACMWTIRGPGAGLSDLNGSLTSPRWAIYALASEIPQWPQIAPRAPGGRHLTVCRKMYRNRGLQLKSGRPKKDSMVQALQTGREIKGGIPIWDWTGQQVCRRGG